MPIPSKWKKAISYVFGVHRFVYSYHKINTIVIDQALDDDNFFSLSLFSESIWSFFRFTKFEQFRLN